jgi:hypothetical protein
MSWIPTARILPAMSRLPYGEGPISPTTGIMSCGQAAHRRMPQEIHRFARSGGDVRPKASRLRSLGFRFPCTPIRATRRTFREYEPRNALRPASDPRVRAHTEAAPGTTGRCGSSNPADTLGGESSLLRSQSALPPAAAVGIQYNHL